MGQRSSKIGGAGGSADMSNAAKIELMEYYVGPEGFDMNTVARGIPLTDKNSQSDYSEDEIRAMMNDFSRMLDNESLPNAERVYRGSTYDTLLESTGLSAAQIAANPEALVGRTITERGFMSTTHSRSMAEEYANGSVLWDIDLPKGAKAIHQNSVLKYLDGDEVTVQRNAKLKIDSAHNSDGMTVIKAHYVGISGR